MVPVKAKAAKLAGANHGKCDIDFDDSIELPTDWRHEQQWDN